MKILSQVSYFVRLGNDGTTTGDEEEVEVFGFDRSSVCFLNLKELYISIFYFVFYQLYLHDYCWLF